LLACLCMLRATAMASRPPVAFRENGDSTGTTFQANGGLVGVALPTAPVAPVAQADKLDSAMTVLTSLLSDLEQELRDHNAQITELDDAAKSSSPLPLSGLSLDVSPIGAKRQAAATSNIETKESPRRPLKEAASPKEAATPSAPYIRNPRPSDFKRGSPEKPAILPVSKLDTALSVLTSQLADLEDELRDHNAQVVDLTTVTVPNGVHFDNKGIAPIAVAMAPPVVPAEQPAKERREHVGAPVYEHTRALDALPLQFPVHPQQPLEVSALHAQPFHLDNALSNTSARDAHQMREVQNPILPQPLPPAQRASGAMQQLEQLRVPSPQGEARSASGSDATTPLTNDSTSPTPLSNDVSETVNALRKFNLSHTSAHQASNNSVSSFATVQLVNGSVQLPVAETRRQSLSGASVETDFATPGQSYKSVLTDPVDIIATVTKAVVPENRAPSDLPKPNSVDCTRSLDDKQCVEIETQQIPLDAVVQQRSLPQEHYMWQPAQKTSLPQPPQNQSTQPQQQQQQQQQQQSVQWRQLR